MSRQTLRYPVIIGLALVWVVLGTISVLAQKPQWYVNYQAGLEAVDAANWQLASQYFQEAIRIKNDETNKLRAFGAIFIEYFPHRELGICYYHLGDYDNARQYLQFSISRKATDRAKDYLNRVNSGNYDTGPSTPPANNTPPASNPPTSIPVTPDNNGSSAANDISIVGERMSLAVLPFESKGIMNQLGDIDLFDKIVTSFVNAKRFKVFERAELQRILEEQKLGASGVLDVSTAAQFGRAIGVDAVVVGSITRSTNSASVDARLIDAETAEIITAKDAISSNTSLQGLSDMIVEMVNKVKADLHLVQGYVLKVDGDRLTVDLGHRNGVKKGLKCHVFREGEGIIHPVTKEVIRSVEEICEMQITEVFDVYSVGIITKSKSGYPATGDRLMTK